MEALELVEWSRLHSQPSWLQLQVLDLCKVKLSLHVLQTFVVTLLSRLFSNGGQSIHPQLLVWVTSLWIASKRFRMDQEL